VLLCSSYVVGDGLSLALDAACDALDVQHRQRFSKKERPRGREGAGPPVAFRRLEAEEWLEQAWELPPREGGVGGQISDRE